MCSCPCIFFFILKSLVQFDGGGIDESQIDGIVLFVNGAIFLMIFRLLILFQFHSL